MPSYPYEGGSNIINTSSLVRIVSADFDADSGTFFVDESANKVGILTRTPGFALDVNGDIKIRTGGTLIFPDGSSMNAAGVGSANVLSNNDDLEIAADADASAAGDIHLNIGADTFMSITNNGDVQIDNPTTGAGVSSPALHLMGNHFSDATDHEIEATLQLITNADPYLRISISDDGTTPATTGVIDVKDTSILPVTDDSVDLGSASLKFKNVYVDGTIFADNITNSGSMTASFVSTAIDYLATATDFMIAVDAVGGAVEITLPTAVGIAGQMYVIKKIDASAFVVTITPDGVETIDGDTPAIITAQWTALTLVSDGANWLIT